MLPVWFLPCPVGHRSMQDELGSILDCAGTPSIYPPVMLSGLTDDEQSERSKLAYLAHVPGSPKWREAARSALCLLVNIACHSSSGTRSVPTLLPTLDTLFRPEGLGDSVGADVGRNDTGMGVSRTRPRARCHAGRNRHGLSAVLSPLSS